MEVTRHWLGGASPRGLADGTRRVIVGIDDSSGGFAALRWAVEFARSRRLPLVALRAWDLALPRHGGRRLRPPGHNRVVLVFDGAQLRAAATVAVQRAFRAAVGGVPPDLNVEIVTPGGHPGKALTAAASRDGDMLVLGTWRGLGWKRAVHGTVSGYCVKHSGLPVVVVGSDTAPDAGRDRGKG